MKIYRHILLLICLVAGLLAKAAPETPNDTVYFYDSWESMMYMEPSASVVNPYIEAYTPYEIHIETGDERVNQMIKEKHIAATLGDSIWLINSEYLKREFKGDTHKLKGHMPVFFNEKLAFVMYVGFGDNVSLSTILFGDSEDSDYSSVVDYYYIDFANHKVRKVTHEVLSELLEDFHDLQVRYEGMKDYKKRHIIRYFFNEFVERATLDPMRPDILKLVD